MTEFTNPFEEPRHEAPAERHVRFAGNIVAYSSKIGGPKFNQDAVASVLDSIEAWLVRWYPQK